MADGGGASGILGVMVGAMLVLFIGAAVLGRVRPSLVLVGCVASAASITSSNAMG